MRTYHSASGSSAEDLFIELFSDTFGAEKAGYLYSQYPFSDIYQNSRFADFLIENGGRKVAIEIDFGKKKKEYTASKIVITKEMGTSDVMDWNLESITKRDIRVSDEVVKIMNRWNNEYLNIPASEGKAEEPSEEELAQIEKFKKNGWI